MRPHGPEPHGLRAGRPGLRHAPTGPSAGFARYSEPDDDVARIVEITLADAVRRAALETIARVHQLSLREFLA